MTLGRSHDLQAIHFGMNHVLSNKKFAIILLPLMLAACSHEGDFDETGGIKVVRSACPAVALPAHTGDVTLFNPETSHDAAAIDVVATITNLRNTCTPNGDQINANATFDVLGQRSNTAGARTVTLPYYAVVTRAGTEIKSKQIGQVTLSFADGQSRAQTSGTAAASIATSEATLSPKVEAQINRKRKAGDLDAAVDPMANPVVREAVQQASFELLVGFQLTDAQLVYNATR